MYDMAMSQKNNVTSIRPKSTFFSCLKIYYKMSFFKASPDQLPFNASCAIKALAVYCVINFGLLDTHSSVFDVLLKVAVEMGLITIFLKIGLKVTQKPERFVQTFSALIGIGMIISLFSIPIYYLFIPQFLQQQDINQTVINITVLLLVWNLAVISYIFKRALEVSTLMSAVIAFNYLIVFEIIIISMASGSA